MERRISAAIAAGLLAACAVGACAPGASAPPSATASPTIAVTPSGTASQAEAASPPLQPGEIAGRVTVNGVAQQGVAVKLLPPVEGTPGDQVAPVASTDASGRFTFARVEPGEHALSVVLRVERAEWDGETSMSATDRPCRADGYESLNYGVSWTDAGAGTMREGVDVIVRSQRTPDNAGRVRTLRITAGQRVDADVTVVCRIKPPASPSGATPSPASSPGGFPPKTAAAWCRFTVDIGAWFGAFGPLASRGLPTAPIRQVIADAIAAERRAVVRVREDLAILAAYAPMREYAQTAQSAINGYEARLGEEAKAAYRQADLEALIAKWYDRLSAFFLYLIDAQPPGTPSCPSAPTPSPSGR